MTEEQREIRRLKKYLATLTDAVLVYLASVDGAVAKRQDIPRDLSEFFGGNSNFLDAQNDAARYFGLSVDYRRDNKKTATTKARKRFGLPTSAAVKS